MEQTDLQPEFTLQDFAKILEDAQEILYITIGPLHSLAALLQNAAIRSRVRHLFIMGGGLHEFNCSHNTEFNFSKNPAAVQAVLHSDIPITLFPLDLTNWQRISSEEIRALERHHAVAEAIPLLLWNLQANTTYNHIPAAVLHDAMPLLYLIHPQAFQVQKTCLTCDEWGSIRASDAGTAVSVAMNAQKDLLIRALQNALCREKTASPV